MMVDGGVQITRWLNIGGSAQKGPSIFYDSEAPFQGYRRSASLRVGLQPNSRVNSNTSYSFVTFENRSTGVNAYRVHILNLRNTYQFSPRFFVRGVAQFDSSRERVLADFLASVRAVARHRRARWLWIAVWHTERRTSVRPLQGHRPRVLLQGVLSRALLMAATSRPAFLPSRR